MTFYIITAIQEKSVTLVTFNLQKGECLRQFPFYDFQKCNVYIHVMNLNNGKLLSIFFASSRSFSLSNPWLLKISFQFNNFASPCYPITLLTPEQNLLALDTKKVQIHNCNNIPYTSRREKHEQQTKTNITFLILFPGFITK